MKKRHKSIPKNQKLKPFKCCPICGKERRNGYFRACKDCRGQWHFVEIGPITFTWWFVEPNIHIHADTQKLNGEFITRDRLINFHDLVYSCMPAQEILMREFQEIHDEILKECPYVKPMLT